MMEEGAAPNIDINPNDWVEIRRILRTCVPEYEVWAFGSRAKWTAKPYSDLDLAIRSDKPLSLEKAAELRSALDESTIPIKVDFVDWAATSESFRKIIEADKVVVLRPAAGLSGWTFKRLIDCTVDGVLSYGIVQPGQNHEHGVPIVRVNNISTGQLHIEEPLRVAPEIETNYQRTRLEGGEVLLTVVGTTGQSAIVPKELAGWNVARAVAVIRPKPEIGARWIHICLQSKTVQQFLDERANTTVQKTLNLSDIKEALIPIPPPDVKEMIESTAVGLDDKIELNRRMKATLEAMARALFHSWFVDFDPIRRKLDGNPPAAPDAATAANLSGSFESSEIGNIPNGWRVGTLAEVCDFSRSTINPSNFPNELFDHYSLPAFDEGRTPKIELGGAILSNKLAVVPGSVLLSKLNPHIPRTWLPDLHETRRSVCSTEFIVASPRSGLSREFLFSLFTSTGFAATYGTLVTGTTGSHQRIRPESVMEMKIVIPTSPLIEAFTSLSKPLFNQINRNIDESRTLADVRAALLPKLLGGELVVHELEPSLS
jgi:type I restriction enzyme, S subunit